MTAQAKPKETDRHDSARTTAPATTLIERQIAIAANAGRNDLAAELLRQLRSIDADRAAIVAAQHYGDASDWIW